MPADAPRIVFLDLETSGANFARDRIIEVGLVEVGPAGVTEWSSLIQPDTSISSFITGLTGIDDSMLIGAPRFADIADELHARLRGALFVAHNARFDYGFLRAEFGRLGMRFAETVVCTVKLSRKLFPQHHKHNLDSLIERHGIVVGARHRALADARVLWDLWQCWHREVAPEATAAAIAALTRPVTLPAHLDPALADELPESHGAYALLDAESRPLVVGRASNLRQKVLGHFADARAKQAPIAAVQSVEWVESAGEFGARLHEIGLIRRQKPVSPELCAWRLKECGPGDFRPEIVLANETPMAAGAEPLYGLYLTVKESRQALRKLAEAHFLCPAILGLEEVKPGKPCSSHKSKICRGVCVEREPIAKHSARLMTALAKSRLKDWPFAGLVALVERDEFGMREDFHLFADWRYLGMANDPEMPENSIDTNCNISFDPDIYRALLKYIGTNKIRVVNL